MSRFLSSSLFLAILTLLGVGLVQVYSSSFVFATESYGDGLYFFKRQVFFVLLGLFFLYLMIHIPFTWIEKYGWWSWLGVSFLLFLTFVPGVGVKVGGAYRWIQGPLGFRFEPVELLKVCLGPMVATLYNREKTTIANVPWYLVLIVVMLPLLLLLKQPDFGSFSIILMVALGLLFSFGLRWRLVISALVGLIPLFYFLIMKVPYRKERVLGVLDPWSDPAQRGFQVIQSMLSFHSGGLFGVGLGRGQGKLFFLPEAHTDFTLAVFGEEMGFVGFMMLLSIYCFVVIRGIQISFKTEDKFKRIVALSASLTLAFSFFINAGVVMGLLPTKGLTLPFLSYGGSSLVFLCVMYGMVLNIENTLGNDQIKSRFNINKWNKDSSGER